MDSSSSRYSFRSSARGMRYEERQSDDDDEVSVEDGTPTSDESDGSIDDMPDSPGTPTPAPVS